MKYKKVKKTIVRSNSGVGDAAGGTVNKRRASLFLASAQDPGGAERN
jgi:hypothetical protein